MYQIWQKQTLSYVRNALYFGGLFGRRVDIVSGYEVLHSRVAWHHLSTLLLSMCLHRSNFHFIIKNENGNSLIFPPSGRVGSYFQSDMENVISVPSTAHVNFFMYDFWYLFHDINNPRIIALLKTNQFGCINFTKLVLDIEQPTISCKSEMWSEQKVSF